MSKNIRKRNEMESAKKTEDPAQPRKVQSQTHANHCVPSITYGVTCESVRRVVEHTRPRRDVSACGCVLMEDGLSNGVLMTPIRIAGCIGCERQKREDDVARELKPVWSVASQNVKPRQRQGEQIGTNLMKNLAKPKRCLSEVRARLEHRIHRGSSAHEAVEFWERSRLVLSGNSMHDADAVSR